MGMKINLGSGYKRFPDFFNVDADKNCNPDYVVDLESGRLPFKDDSIEYVIAHHILEHIGEGFIPLMKELYRVCENNAVIDIEVPHFRHWTYSADPTHKRPITGNGMALFNQDLNRNAIETGSASSTLGIIFNVNFKIIDYSLVLDEKYAKLIENMSDKEKELVSNQNDFFLLEKMKLQVIKD